MHEAINASKCKAGINILNASIIRKCRLSQDQQTINLFLLFLFFFFFFLLNQSFLPFMRSQIHALYKREKNTYNNVYINICEMMMKGVLGRHHSILLTLLSKKNLIL
jgi:hypothetical protein